MKLGNFLLIYAILLVLIMITVTSFWWQVNMAILAFLVAEAITPWYERHF